MTRIVLVLGVLALGVTLGVAAGPAHAQSDEAADSGLRGAITQTPSSSALRGTVDANAAVDTVAPSRPADLLPTLRPSVGVEDDSIAREDVLPDPEAALDTLALPDNSLNLPPLRTPRRRTNPEVDPFEPVGVKVGSFVVTPYAELREGYDSNALRVRNGPGSAFTVIGGGFASRSDWSRHALDVQLRGGYTSYDNVTANNRPEAEALVRGRLDVNSQTRIDAIVRGTITTDAAGSVDAVQGATEPPLIYTTSLDLGVTRRFNRLELGAAGLIVREDHAAAALVGGGHENLADRNVTGYGVRLRGGYEMMPGVKPFVQLLADHREYDIVPDASGYDRNSHGITATVGSEFRLSDLLTGTASAGYTWRYYVDPALQDIDGLVADASLRWEATGLTTVILGARSGVEETSQAGASGNFVHQARVEVEHAFRRWLIGEASVAYRINDYVGSDLEERTLEFGAGLTYKLGRWAELTAQASHLRLDSSVPGSDYTANVVQVGLRLQR
ncbi:outer membrane beta-barrel protein [Bosea sp. 117]|uniref:outer membrane beta-barrel protein n=1 Tax=Bosea sp. 117 TaxID=1125973 RepID=UPI00068A8BD6|nr:outer membrane beta-barrel protein [Bosea sp. 117]